MFVIFNFKVNATLNNSTALHLACQAGNLACISLLLKFGAKRTARDSTTGNEIIHSAVYSGNVEIVRLLFNLNLKRKSKLNKSVKNKSSSTVTSKNPTKKLITNSEEINLLDLDDSIQTTVSSEVTGVVESFTTSNDEIEQNSNNFAQPNTSRLDQPNELINVNCRNALSQTPLHLAIHKQDFLMTQYLINDLHVLINLQVIVNFFIEYFYFDNLY